MTRGVRRYLPVANPESRFASTTMEYDDPDVNPGAPLEVLVDHARTILASNDSPDVGFDWSVNPYRGCFHGCAYCYARPTHEYLSLGAGSDFERRILVKPNAAALLREAFDKRSWKGELVVFSGVTDCYQPLEAHMKLTRACLEVCVEYRNPAGVITKSPIVERDVDLLVELGRVATCRVSVSIPFWRADVARAMEPYVTTPARRMTIVETLAKAGVRVGVSVSPIVPGLNDEDIGDVLRAARDAGASHAFFVLLRLPGSVKETFEQALRDKLPLRADKVLRRVREAYGGRLYDPRWGVRGSGGGPYAETIRALFERTARRYGLRSDEREASRYEESFRRPDRAARDGQTSFDF
jgi:DNA repair photolyase